jgi:hypothetical protein
MILDPCGSGKIRYILPRALLLNLKTDIRIMFFPRAAGLDVAVDIAVTVAIDLEILLSPRTRVRLDSTSPLPSTSGFSSPRLSVVFYQLISSVSFNQSICCSVFPLVRQQTLLQFQASRSIRRSPKSWSWASAPRGAEWASNPS